MKKKIKNMIDDFKFEISWNWGYYILDPIYNIKNGVKNLWKFKFIIWNDRWYDYSYFIKLIKFKLQDNINNWHKSHYIGSEFTKKRMIIILKRIEEYETNLDNLHELYYTKKMTRDKYKKLKKKLINKTWGALGRNITRFWD